MSARGTTDEVSSHVCLDLPFISLKADQKIAPPRDEHRLIADMLKLQIANEKKLGAGSADRD